MLHDPSSLDPWLINLPSMETYIGTSNKHVFFRGDQENRFPEVFPKSRTSKKTLVEMTSGA
jgi:hypothetical protein